MAITYSLGFSPLWYLADLSGLPLGGGYLATYSSLDHSELNPVYEAAADLPWPYVSIPNSTSLGIQFDMNGSQGPFYFKLDSSVPTKLYYLEAYNSQGVLQWTMDSYFPSNGSGGGTITTALNLSNLVSNNVMLENNVGPSPIAPGTFYTIAPGANHGLVKTASNAGPDICFVKNNTTATDSLVFNNFTLGTTFPNGEPTPTNYLNYTSTAGTSETQKCVQFPITKGVQNLQQQPTTITIFMRSNSGTPNVTLNWLQFYGDGGGSSPGSGPAYLVTPIKTITLSSGWTKYIITAPDSVVPDTTGGSVGAAHNDGLFLQVQYPLNQSCDIDFTKLSLYAGNYTPTIDFSTDDMINANINTPRTGDYRTSINQFAPFGWVACNNGTIGNASSNASNRAANDTFPLFNFLWNISVPFTPMFTSLGALASRGATAIADYIANNQISLTNTLGNVMAGSTSAILPTQNFTTSIASATNLSVTNAASWSTGTPVFLTGSPPAGLSTSTLYYSIYVNSTTIQLSLNPGGSAVSFTPSVGSGTIQTVNNSLGFYTGEASHTLTVNEMPSHTHTIPQKFDATNAAAGSGVNAARAGSENTGSAGGDAAHNNMQPTLYTNVFLKL